MRPFRTGAAQALDFTPDQKLARVCASGEGAWFDLKAKPYWEAQNVGTIYRDDVVEWLKEVVTSHTDYNRINQRWVETPKGYIYAPYVQPVYNRPNQALLEFPPETKEAGMWVEQTIPVGGYQAGTGTEFPLAEEPFETAHLLQPGILGGSDQKG